MVVTSEMRTARLVLTPPPAGSLLNISHDGPVGALQLGAPSAPLPSGAVAVPVTVPPTSTFSGLVRVSAWFATARGSPVELAVHYLVLPPLPSLLSRYGAFTSAKVYFNDSDLFGRTHSFMGWDDTTQGMMLQEDRVFVAGLSDEAGSGSALGFAAVSATTTAPDALALAQLATFVARTAIGTKPDGQGNPVSLVSLPGYGVRASMFWANAGTTPAGMPGFPYAPNPSITWARWDEPRGEALWRAYNYADIAPVFYSLYRVAREADAVAGAVAALAAASGGTLDGLDGWEAYLGHAVNVTLGMWNQTGGIGGQAQFGLMAGSFFALIRDAAAAEGWTAEAAALDAVMKQRLGLWESLAFPFGSEFPWDSTGQEEVFTHSAAYGNYSLASSVRDSVEAYTPVVPNALYAGSARGFWDFSVNGAQPTMAIGATERGLQHYRSGCASSVLLGAATLWPSDALALAAGYAASLGPLTTINATSGAPSMAWHADPSLLRPDAYTADWGVGASVASQWWGCYVGNDTDVGLTGFGCDVQAAADSWALAPTDPVRRMLLLGPLGLRVRLERSTGWANATLQWTPAVAPAGPGSGSVTIALAPGACAVASTLRVAVETPSLKGQPDSLPTLLPDGAWRWAQPSVPPPLVRGAYELPCGTAALQLAWGS